MEWDVNNDFVFVQQFYVAWRISIERSGPKFLVMLIWQRHDILVAHNVAYRHLHVDEAQAEAQFVEVGGSCAAIRSQATAVDVTGTMPMKLKWSG